jgi:hypothetical protein
VKIAFKSKFAVVRRGEDTIDEASSKCSVAACCSKTCIDGTAIVACALRRCARECSIWFGLRKQLAGDVDIFGYDQRIVYIDAAKYTCRLYRVERAVSLKPSRTTARHAADRGGAQRAQTVIRRARVDAAALRRRVEQICRLIGVGGKCIERRRAVAALDIEMLDESGRYNKPTVFYRRIAAARSGYTCSHAGKNPIKNIFAVVVVCQVVDESLIQPSGQQIGSRGVARRNLRRVEGIGRRQQQSCNSV